MGIIWEIFKSLRVRPRREYLQIYKTPLRHISLDATCKACNITTALGNVEMCNTQAHMSLCDHPNDRLTTRHLPSLFSDIPGPSLHRQRGRLQPKDGARQIHYVSYSWMYASKWTVTSSVTSHCPPSIRRTDSRSQIRPGGHTERLRTHSRGKKKEKKRRHL